MRKASSRCKLVLGLVSSAVLIGCASVSTEPSVGMRVEPLYQVRAGGDKANSRAFFALGQAYQGEGRWQKAMDAYSRAAFSDPDDAEAFNSLGVARAMLDQSHSAVAAFAMAVELVPDDVRYINNLGFALLLDAQYARAADYLRAALVRDPGHEQARANLAKAEFMLAPLAKESAPTPTLEALPAPAGPSLASPVTPLAETVPPVPAVTAVTADTAVATVAVAATESSEGEARLAGFRFEIANGNGMPGAAGRLRSWLEQRGIEGARLKNLRPFVSASTVVQYMPGHRSQALEVARRMPGGIGVQPFPDGLKSADVRVVIGHDVSVSSECPRSWPCASGDRVAEANALALPSAAR